MAGKHRNSSSCSITYQSKPFEGHGALWIDTFDSGDLVTQLLLKFGIHCPHFSGTLSGAEVLVHTCHRSVHLLSPNWSHMCFVTTWVLQNHLNLV